MILDERANNESNAGSHPELRDADRSSTFFESVSRYLQETSCLSKKSTTIFLPTVQLANFKTLPLSKYTNQTCDYEVNACRFSQASKCSPNFRYRTYDGSCNNLEKPLMGRRLDCQRRLLPADYRDGLSSFRTSIDGSPLPNPRLLSVKLLGSEDKR